MNRGRSVEVDSTGEHVEHAFRNREPGAVTRTVQSLLLAGAIEHDPAETVALVIQSDLQLDTKSPEPSSHLNTSPIWMVNPVGD